MPTETLLLGIEVDGFHVLWNNSIEGLPAVGLIEVIESKTAERDLQLFHPVIINIDCRHLSGIRLVPLLPAAFPSPRPKTVGGDKIRCDSIVQSDYGIRNHGVDRMKDTAARLKDAKAHHSTETDYLNTI